jgi:hypothetical protein
MDNCDIKFEDAGSCLARISEAQGNIDAAFALLNDPVVNPKTQSKPPRFFSIRFKFSLLRSVCCMTRG